MTTSNGNRIARRLRAFGFARRDGRIAQVLERAVTPRRHRALDRICAEDIVWPSGEGHEIGTIKGDLNAIVGIVRRRMNRGTVREPVSYGEDGPARALVLGQPRKETVACLVTDESQAPGVVAVIADVGADPAAVIRAVEKTVGRGFEVRRHAL